MTTGIFATHALKYYERGYNVIPITPGDKFPPLLTEWQKWADERIPQELLEEWVDAFPNANIAMVCGKISGSVLDIDSDKLEVITLAPIGSNMIRKNSKGMGMHFKFIDHKNVSVKDVYDLLAHKRYSLLPPSTFIKECSTYNWINETNVVDVSELCELPLPRLDKWIIDSAKFATPRSNTVRIDREMPFNDIGRNNKLNAIAYAKASDIHYLGADLTECIEQIIAYDNKWHSPAWLTDPKEADQHRNNPHGFLTKMIQRHLKKFQSEPEGVKPFIEISTSQAQPEKGEFSERDLMIQEQAGVITRMIPKNGIFDLFDQECKLASNKETPILNFAASLSLCSVLAANKLRYNDTWPNMYIAALAPSGVGKNNPQRMIKKILMQSRDGDILLGPSNYASARAFIGSFKHKRQRLDMIDEGTELLNKMKDSKNNPTFAGMREGFLKVFSESNSFTSEIAAQTQGAKNPTIYNPCLSVLVSDVTNSFMPALSGELIQKGFIARWLVFMHPDRKLLTRESVGLPFGYGRKNPSLHVNPELIKRVEQWTTRPIKQLIDVPCAVAEGFQVDAENITYDEVVINKLVTDINFENAKITQAAADKGFLSVPSYERVLEHMSKLMLCYCVSQETREITPQIVHWAHDLWKAQFNFIRHELEVQKLSGDKVEISRVDRKFEMYIKELQTTHRDHSKVMIEMRKLRSRAFMLELGSSEAQTRYLKSKESMGFLKLFNQHGKRASCEIYLDEFNKE